MKKELSILTIVFLLIPLAFAISHVRIDKTVSEAKISPLGEAVFDVTFTNDRNEPDIFLLELSDVAWSLRTKNTYEFTTGIDLKGLASHTSTLYMKPGSNVKPGTYFLELKARSFETGDVSSEVFVITVDPKVVDYNTVNVPVEVVGSTSIDPAKTNSMKLLVKNPNPVFLSNLTIDVSSKFLNKKAVIDIEPNSEQVIDFTLNMDKSTEKQEDILNIVLTLNGKQVATATKTIYIKEFRQPYKVDSSVEKRFLQIIHTIKFTNTEGAQKTQDAPYLKPKSYAIIETSPAAETQTFDNQQYLVWKGISLNPNDVYTVTVTEDYRPIAAAIIIAAILIICYFTYRSPIIVKKKAFGIHKKDTGNNEIKIMLYVKNRSRRAIEKVRVLDRLPVIHRVEEDFGPGTPEPRYRRSSEGIILDWDITLAPLEERIFVYKVKSSLPLVGEFTLKPCVVQYGHKNKRTASAPYRLMID